MTSRPSNDEPCNARSACRAATAYVCPFGFPEARGAFDSDPVHGDDPYDPAGPHRLPTEDPEPVLGLRTETRGCACTPEETRDGVCRTLDRCPPDGAGGGRWSQATFPGQPWTTSCPDGWCFFVPDHPTHHYSRLYAGLDDPLFGLANWPRYATAVGPYAEWYRSRGPGAALQGWNYLTDNERIRAPDGTQIFPRDVKRDAWLWFRPTAGSGFPGVRNRFGNTYVTASGIGATPVTVRTGGADDPTGGGPLPCSDIRECMEMRHAGDLRAMQEMGGDLSVVATLDPGCPNCGPLMFDVQGTQVGGILVGRWNRNSNLFVDLVGSKAATEPFDVKGASVAVAVEPGGKISHYWTLGGLGPDGWPTDQMWVGERTVALKDDGSGTYEYFQLAAVPAKADGMWPAARVGAALAIRGDMAAAGQVKDTAVAAAGGAFGASGPGAGVPDGRGPDGLVLVGGDSGAGLLADIWTFDGAWRRVDELPGVAEGLADAGGVVADGSLWLFGGRQAGTASADLWRVDLATGEAWRAPRGTAAWPAARVRPAVTYDVAAGELLVFGGTAGGAGLTDVWAYDTAAGTWRQVAPSCCGAGCPAATGTERLVTGERPGELAVVANPYGPARNTRSWTLAAGGWTTWPERIGLQLAADCDNDFAVEPGWGARCGAGDDGFPAYGRALCGDSALECREPLVPGQVLSEQVLPGIAAVAAQGGDVAALTDRRLALYHLDATGTLRPTRSLRLARPGFDLALVAGHALVADRQGLTSYSLASGAEVSSVPTCGNARRVLPNGGRAYVVSLRSLLVVDVVDPASLRVLADYRVASVPGSAWLRESSRCSAFHAGADLLCDVSGLCGWSGRIAAAESANRLFLNLGAETFVVDFATGIVPVVSPPLATGLAADMRAEGDFLYVNRVGTTTGLYALRDGAWTAIGEHDVRRWVQGVVEAGPFSLWRRPGRLLVGTRQ